MRGSRACAPASFLLVAGKNRSRRGGAAREARNAQVRREDRRRLRFVDTDRTSVMTVQTFLATVGFPLVAAWMALMIVLGRVAVRELEAEAQS